VIGRKLRLTSASNVGYLIDDEGMLCYDKLSGNCDKKIPDFYFQTNVFWAFFVSLSVFL